MGSPDVGATIDTGAAAASASPSAESTPGPLDRLLEEMHQALVRASHTVDREQLHAAAKVLAGARRIVLVGSGTSASLVQWGVLQFSSAGIPWRPPPIRLPRSSCVVSWARRTCASR